MDARPAPALESAISEDVRDAGARGTPLRIVGGGTRSQFDGPEGARAVSTAGLTGISLYEPGAMTMVVQSGTPVETIEETLAAEGQRLPFEPMDHRRLLGTEGTPTIGGVVAGNVSGPRRIQTGACRDHVLGVRFVDGRGDVLKSGGRVMKNVTGLDLGKLLCGSLGTLGILTEISLKVMPRPERAATLVFGGVSAKQAVDLFCSAMRTPFEVSGAAWRDETAYLRVEGLAIQVDNRLSRLVDHLGRSPDETPEGAAHDALWSGLRDLHAMAETDDAVWRISTRPTAAAGIAAELISDFDARVQIDWGGARLWAAIPDHRGDAEHIRRLRDSLGPQGHATMVRPPAGGAGDVPVFQPQPPRLSTLSKALRAQFDPAGILNPDLMAS